MARSSPVKRAGLLPLLAAVVVAGCGGARSAGGSLPPGFVPVALSALDDREFFVLGSVPCLPNRCYTVERTTDGGRRFVRLSAPRGLSAEGTAPRLRFADPRDGFVWVPFGWGAFWSTHDGGATWRRLPSPSVVSLTTADAEAYAVVARCRLDGCSAYRFARGPASTSRWTVSPLPFTPDGPVLDLAARGRDVWLLATPVGSFPRHDLLAHSTDGGRTFVTRPGPCNPGLDGTVEPSSARVVWAVCPTGMMAGAARSIDGGLTFEPLHSPPLVNSAQLAAASDSVAVLAANGVGRPLYRTTNGGATWTPTAPPGRDNFWSFVAFSDRLTGNALLQVDARTAAVWRTSDGGTTWRKIGP